MGYRDPNSVAIRDFYESSFNVNYLALFMRDQVKPIVKQAFYSTIEDWLCTLEDRDEHAGRLLPYLLSGLFEPDHTTAVSVVESLNQLGILVERQKETNFRRSKQTGVDSLWTMGSAAGHPSLPVPFSSRPRIGTRFLVQVQLSKILPAIIRELQDSINYTNRLKALKLLKYLVFISEEQICEYTHKLLPVLFQNCRTKLNEDKPEIDEELFQIVRFIGRFSPFKDLHYLLLGMFDQSGAARSSLATAPSEAKDDSSTAPSKSIANMPKFIFLTRAAIRGFFEVALHSEDGSLDLDVKFPAFKAVLQIFGSAANLELISDLEDIYQFSFLCLEIVQIWFQLNSQSKAILSTSPQSSALCVGVSGAKPFEPDGVQRSLLTQFEKEFEVLFSFWLSHSRYFWAENLFDGFGLSSLFKAPRVVSKENRLMMYLSRSTDRGNQKGDFDDVEAHWPLGFDSFFEIQKFFENCFVSGEFVLGGERTTCSLSNFAFKKLNLDFSVLESSPHEMSILKKISGHLQQKKLFAAEDAKSNGYHLTVFEARKLVSLLDRSSQLKCSQAKFSLFVDILASLFQIERGSKLGFRLNAIFIQIFYNLFENLNFAIEKMAPSNLSEGNNASNYSEMLENYFQSGYSNLNNLDKHFFEKISTFLRLFSIKFDLLQKKLIPKKCVLRLYPVVLQFSEFVDQKMSIFESHMLHLEEYIGFLFSQCRIYKKRYFVLIGSGYSRQSIDSGPDR